MKSSSKFKPDALYPSTAYLDAENYLNGRESRKVCNHTYLYRKDEDTTAIKFWHTDVVKYNKDGTIVLDSGGWTTNTTRDRMDIFNPYGVVVTIKNRWWFYVTSNVKAAGQYYEYEDGMTISGDGVPNTQRRHVILLGERFDKKFTEKTAKEFVAGLELKDIRALLRNQYLKFFALRHCKKEFIPMFLNVAEVGHVIEDRLKGE